MTDASAEVGVSTVPWQRFSPAWQDGTGAHAQVPPPGGQVSLERIAQFLGRIAVMRDHAPTSPWAGLHRVPVARPVRPEHHSLPAELAERFDAAVLECVQDAGTVAVAVSGGIDSLAVLAAVHRLPGRRVVAVTSDSVDSSGRSPAALVRRQLAALDARIPLLVLPGRLAEQPLPAWRPEAPGFHSTPREHAGLARAAAGAGAQVLLTGGGADQLLALPDVGPPWLGRFSARIGRPAPVVPDAVLRTSGERRTGLWWAARVGARYRRCAGPALLTEEFAGPVEAAFTDFARRQVAHHVSQAWTLHRALLAERLYPHDALPPATDLPLRSPFHVPAFADYCWRLPMRARWSRHEPTPYRQHKALLVGLVPGPARAALPASSMTSVGHAVAYWREENPEARLLVEHGVVRPDWRELVRSVYDVQMVAECERWLAGALDAGARIAGAAAVRP